ncbi:MAG: hypothetical protein [Caudoviricetes sp.]|nr:MAG: hypothetical protein [Caudoviricetes sp.]
MKIISRSVDAEKTLISMHQAMNYVKLHGGKVLFWNDRDYPKSLIEKIKGHPDKTLHNQIVLQFLRMTSELLNEVKSWPKASNSTVKVVVIDTITSMALKLKIGKVLEDLGYYVIVTQQTQSSSEKAKEMKPIDKPSDSVEMLERITNSPITFTSKQTLEMCRHAALTALSQIREMYDLVPKAKPATTLDELYSNLNQRVANDNVYNAGNVAVKGSAEQVFRNRTMPCQWNDEKAITVENVKNAVTVLFNRGYGTFTVRDIVAVIKEFTNSTTGSKLANLRGSVTKRFVSKAGKLLGTYESKKNGNSYVFLMK